MLGSEIYPNLTLKPTQNRTRQSMPLFNHLGQQNRPENAPEILKIMNNQFLADLPRLRGPLVDKRHRISSKSDPQGAPKGMNILPKHIPTNKKTKCTKFRPKTHSNQQQHKPSDRK